jgi:hypothetical protein
LFGRRQPVAHAPGSDSYTQLISNFSLFFFEIGLLVCAIAISRQRGFSPPVIRPRWLALAVAALCPVVLRLALLPWWPAPFPTVTDEFSYLLAADTYASGRLTNPQHPLWKHFDSVNILVRPTYASKYPPGQGLVLAAGQVLFHHPWAGVCLGVALMGGAIYWMLEAFIGRRWALTGALLAGLQFGLAGYWMNSYWGGALAAAAGALVLGAAIRQRPVSLGLGVVLLAITRPVEGLIFCIPTLFLLKRRTMLLAAPIVCVGLAGIAYQNWRVTGDPLRLPYIEFADRYQATPAFIWNHVRHDILYVDPFLELNYVKGEVQIVSGPLYERLAVKAWQIWIFYLGPTLTLPFFFATRLRKDRRLRLLWPFAASAAVTVIIVSVYFPHYIAPYTAVFVAFIVQAFRHLNAGRHRIGSRIAAVIPAVVCITVATATFLAITQHSGPTFNSPPGWCCRKTGPWERFFVLDKLEKEPRPQLLIVRYAMIRALPAWVYNPADIDSAKVIFARDFGPCGNQELLHYYKNRQKWLLEVDGYDYKLSPYPENETCGG